MVRTEWLWGNAFGIPHCRMNTSGKPLRESLCVTAQGQSTGLKPHSTVCADCIALYKSHVCVANHNNYSAGLVVLVVLGLNEVLVLSEQNSSFLISVWSKVFWGGWKSHSLPFNTVLTEVSSYTGGGSNVSTNTELKKKSDPNLEDFIRGKRTKLQCLFLL